MKAKDYYNKSLFKNDKKNKAGMYLHDCGLTRSIVFKLQRYHRELVIPDINIEAIRQLVINGKIWDVRNCGEKCVKDICEWLEKQDNDTP